MNVDARTKHCALSLTNITSVRVGKLQVKIDHECIEGEGNLHLPVLLWRLIQEDPPLRSGCRGQYMVSEDGNAYFLN